jgi:hypothetical protein
MTDNLHAERHFMSVVNARIYLNNEGFLFMGAPDRWNRISDDRILYARITRTLSGSTISFSSSIRVRAT